MWRLALLVLIGGCGTILGIHDFEQTPPEVDAPPSLPPCVRDHFDAGSLDALVWQATGTVSIASQQLVIPLAANTVETRSVHTLAAFDMTEGDVLVEVPQAVNQTGFVSNGVQVTVTNASNSSYRMSWGAGSLVASIVDAGNNQQESPAPGYMPGEKLWRFSHRGTTVTLYTSTTGATWTTHVSRTVTTQPTSVTVSLFAAATGTNASPGEAHYDNFEVLTPACQ